MEPLTHFLTGACMGRAGLNRKTACATAVATLAAEAADLDILWGFKGPVEELKHHRGITHTFIAAPFVAALVVVVIGFSYKALEAGRARRRTRSATPGEPSPPSPKPPLRWPWLFAIGLIAALSHILLDWATSYGVRPFLPFNPRWYAGSFVFIAEPVLWALFFFAFAIPWLLGLTDREIGARRPVFRGRGWAIFTLAGMLVFGCWRWAEHAQALNMIGSGQVTTSRIIRSAAEPYPVNPWRWHAIIETPSFYQTAEVDTRAGSVDSDPNSDVLFKPANTAAVEAAKQTFLGKVYLDWGTWAVVRDLGQETVPGSEPPRLPAARTWTTVEFTDLRFAYAFVGGESIRPPAGLSGSVYIIDGREDGGEFMGSQEQK